MKEQLRSYWILLLSLSMGPFFIFVYFLIMESSKTHFTVVVANNDTGVTVNNEPINYGNQLISYLKDFKADTVAVPFTVSELSQQAGLERVKNKKADALIIIHDSFSQGLQKSLSDDSASGPAIEFVGDLTNTNYLLSAVWANEIINEYALQTSRKKRIIQVKETPLGSSASLGGFDMMVPGILIVSLIMLMFTASIAFVSEVENKTIMRLKLSKLTAFEFIGGISIVQLCVGITSVFLTLLTAMVLGFQYTGSISIMIVIAGFTSLSIIAFSLIIAALTKSANEVLVVGNFPMFLFMFFTGAAFPFNTEALFTIAGYPINVQGLMTPTHAISALNKTFIMNMDVSSIIPEIIAIVALTILYFTIGAVIFKHRHLKLT
jgi:ABC-2 type transport system permease protein